jgi:hypothetical protein
VLNAYYITGIISALYLGKKSDSFNPHINLLRLVLLLFLLSREGHSETSHPACKLDNKIWHEVVGYVTPKPQVYVKTNCMEHPANYWPILGSSDCRYTSLSSFQEGNYAMRQYILESPLSQDVARAATCHLLCNFSSLR